jgi:hypothetical protein
MVANEPVPITDRRVARGERRTSGRGGRRGGESHRCDRETIVETLAQLARLREENALLRRAALAFGALAERLNRRMAPAGDQHD